MSLPKDMGNKESIQQTSKLSTTEMNSIREGEVLKPTVSARDTYKQNFQRLHNLSSSSPVKAQPTMLGDKKKSENNQTQQASISSDSTQPREDLIPNYVSIPQPMFSTPGYNNNAVFSGQMIPPMLVQQPMQLPTALPGMFQTGFMYQTLSQGALKTNHASSHFFPPFTKGSLIMLATGNLKPIEELKTADFIESAKVSKMLCLETSTVAKIQDIPNSSTSLIGFAVDDCDSEVMVEKPSDHPFFIYEQGWASCKPSKTLSHYGLPCQQLKIGDICVFLSNQLEMRSGTMAGEGRSEEKLRQPRAIQQNTVSTLGSDLKISDGHRVKGVDGTINGDLPQAQSSVLGEQDESFGPSIVKKPKLDVSSKTIDIVKNC